MKQTELRFNLTKKDYDMNLYLALEFIRKKRLRREYAKYACNGIKDKINKTLNAKGFKESQSG